MKDVSVPADVSAQERWIVRNQVTAIRAEYRMTGVDTAETYLHLTPANGNPVCWLEATFNKVAELRIGTHTVAAPKYGVRERVERREAWEKANQKELAEYRRLKRKFEGEGEEQST